MIFGSDRGSDGHSNLHSLGASSLCWIMELHACIALGFWMMKMN